MYVVDVFQTKQRYKFAAYPQAFRLFKEMRRLYRGVALWHRQGDGRWLRVYMTEGYPEFKSQPW